MKKLFGIGVIGIATTILASCGSSQLVIGQIFTVLTIIL